MDSLEPQLNVKHGFVIPPLLWPPQGSKPVSGIFYAKRWRWMDGKRDNPNSDGWLVEAANLPNGYSPWSVVDAKSPMYLGFLGQRHVREQWKI